MARPTVRPVVALLTQIAEYQLRLIAGMSDALTSRGIPLLVVANQPFGTERTPSLVLDLIRRRVPRGVIALADESQLRGRELPKALAREHLPTVTLGTTFEGSPRVQGDNVGGMRRLMTHVLDERGARRVVLVRGVRHQTDSMVRERVFREELAARGLDLDEDLVLDGEFRQQDAYDRMRRLLARRHDFDAVVALNDPSALGALSAAVDHGLRVPQDVIVTGFDNTEGSVLSWPALTTVDQGLYEQGQAAVELLLGLTDGRRVRDDLQVPARLVIRASTATDGVGVLNSATPEHLATMPGVRWTDGRAFMPISHLSGQVHEIVSSARALQSRVAQQSAALSLNWTMANCRTMNDVITALGPCLGRLGVDRFFLAIDQTPLSGRAVRLAPATHPTAADNPTRLVLSYRDGVTDPAATEVFPRHELLPPDLADELSSGVLLLQPLSIAGRERGYLLYEPMADASSLLTEALRIDLPRTVDTVLSSQELQDHAATLERLVARRTQQLEQANVELQRSVMRDGLTGIANRIAFQQYLERFSGPDATVGQGLAMLMIDVDMFKPYNDHYGHLAGDEALKVVAGCLIRSVREPADLACRYGGEEFAVVLQDGDLQAAMGVARRIRQLLNCQEIPHAASPVARRVTVSIGVAADTVRPGFSVTDLIARADEALYKAKLRGRNRIIASRPRRTAPRRRPDVPPEASAPGERAVGDGTVVHRLHMTPTH